MCKVTPLQNKIRVRTNNGELIANFLADTVEGKYPDAKYHHRLEAAKLLDRYGSDQPESEESQLWGLIPTPEELAADHSRHSRENGNPDGQGGETDNSELNTQNSHVPPSTSSTTK